MRWTHPAIRPGFSWAGLAVSSLTCDHPGTQYFYTPPSRERICRSTLSGHARNIRQSGPSVWRWSPYDGSTWHKKANAQRPAHARHRIHFASGHPRLPAPCVFQLRLTVALGSYRTGLSQNMRQEWSTRPNRSTNAMALCHAWILLGTYVLNCHLDKPFRCGKGLISRELFQDTLFPHSFSSRSQQYRKVDEK